MVVDSDRVAGQRSPARTGIVVTASFRAPHQDVASPFVRTALWVLEFLCHRGWGT